MDWYDEGPFHKSAVGLVFLNTMGTSMQPGEAPPSGAHRSRAWLNWTRQTKPELDRLGVHGFEQYIAKKGGPYEGAWVFLSWDDFIAKQERTLASRR